MIKLTASDYSFDKNIKKAFADSFTRPKMTGQNYWSVSNDDEPFFDYLDYGNFGAVGTFTGQIDYDEAKELNYVRKEPVEYAKGYQIEEKTWRWAKKGNKAATRFVNSLPAKLGYRFYELIEKERYKRFNNAFDGTETTLDTVALCSASHKPDTTQSSSNSNLLTAPMSVAAIEAGRLLGLGTWVDDRDELIESIFTLLLCHTSKQSDARVFTQTPKKPESAYNDLNYIYDEFDVRASVRLSDSNNYFLIDPAQHKESWLWNNNTAVEFDRDQGFDTRVHKFSGYVQFAYMLVSPYSIVGFNVSGT